MRRVFDFTNPNQIAMQIRIFLCTVENLGCRCPERNLDCENLFSCILKNSAPKCAMKWWSLDRL